MEYNLFELYERSLIALKEHMKLNNYIMSKKEWNKIAREYMLLSSETMGYVYGRGFSKLCRNLIKEIHKQKNVS